MTDSRAKAEQDRRTAGGLLGGAVACTVLTFATDNVLPALMAGGMLLGALMTYRRTIDPRPYWSWPAWLVGAAGALLLAWPGGEAERLVLLPLAGVETAVAAVLFALWRRRRHGRGDWIVWTPETSTVLRREWSRRGAIHWAEAHGKPCAISPLDEFPDVTDAVPLYPYRDQPGRAAPRPAGQG